MPEIENIEVMAKRMGTHYYINSRHAKKKKNYFLKEGKKGQ